MGGREKQATVDHLQDRKKPDHKLEEKLGQQNPHLIMDLVFLVSDAGSAELDCTTNEQNL